MSATTHMYDRMTRSCVYLGRKVLEALFHLIFRTRAIKLNKVLNHTISIQKNYPNEGPTCSMPSGTPTGTHRRSVLIFPATFFKDLLNKERISGVS